MQDLFETLKRQRVHVTSQEERCQVRSIIHDVCPGLAGLYAEYDGSWKEFPHIGTGTQAGHDIVTAWRGPAELPSMSFAEFMGMMSPDETADEIDLSLIL